MKKKLFFIGMCIVVTCMAAGCVKKADENGENKNSTQTVQTAQTENTPVTEKQTGEEDTQEAVINKGILEKLTLEKKTFPGVKDERTIPKGTTSCPLHIEDYKWEGDYLYIADCSGRLYAFQWKEEKLEVLLWDKEYSYNIRRDMNGKIYVTDTQKNDVQVIYSLQGGKLEEIATIDNHYMVISMDKEYLYVQENEGEGIKQIRINTSDKTEEEENPVVKNLSAFFEKYNTEDYSIQRWEYEKGNWYVQLMNWNNDMEELYRIDKSGKSEMVVHSSHLAWAGVRQGKMYVSISENKDNKNSENAHISDKVLDEKLYSIDKSGNRELYFNLNQVKELEQNGFQVDMGEFNKEGFSLLEYGPGSQIILYSEKENKMILFSGWEKK